MSAYVIQNVHQDSDPQHPVYWNDDTQRWGPLLSATVIVDPDLNDCPVLFGDWVSVAEVCRG